MEYNQFSVFINFLLQSKLLKRTTMEINFQLKSWEVGQTRRQNLVQYSSGEIQRTPFFNSYTAGG